MAVELVQRDGVKYFSSSILKDTERVRHFFSTRVGGVSEGPYKELNLGIYTADEEKNITENYKRIFNAANLKIDKITYLSQVHGKKFHIVDSTNYKEIRGADGDALITRDRGIAIGVMTADCVPVLIFDQDRGIAAAVHAGWKGTYLNITSSVVDYMIGEMGCKTENIKAAIGPGIGPCCFEVGEEVAEKFTFVSEKNGRKYVDLWLENEVQLKNAGISPENIDNSNLCTLCNSDVFFSYRGDGGNTGRLGAFIEVI